MRFTPTAVDGCWIVDLEPYVDHRGGFARTFCEDEFAAHGITLTMPQANLCWNHTAGTMRGMHRQLPPHAEGKLVRCVRGSIVDCCLDMRPGSPTYGAHVMVELSGENRRSLWLPPYTFHGYLTLTDDTEILYQMSGRYVPGSEDAIRYDDPAFALPWPGPVAVISDKDAAIPDWSGPAAPPRP